MSRENYWIDCISDAFASAGIQATPEQIREVAGSVEISHENIGQLYDPVGGGPSAAEIELAETKRKLDAECRKVKCSHCNGSGGREYDPCWRCRGAGRIDPQAR